jgi:hypothetical protein
LLKATWGQKIESRDVRVVTQNVLEPIEDIKDVPLVTKFAKNEEARQLLQAALRAYGVPNYVYSAPPGTSKERLDILRKAFMNTLGDPVFLEEARKAKLDIEPIDGPKLANIFATLYEIPAQLVAQLRDIVVPQN